MDQLPSVCRPQNFLLIGAVLLYFGSAAVWRSAKYVVDEDTYDLRVAQSAACFMVANVLVLLWAAVLAVSSPPRRSEPRGFDVMPKR